MHGSSTLEQIDWKCVTCEKEIQLPISGDHISSSCVSCGTIGCNNCYVMEECQHCHEHLCRPCGDDLFRHCSKCKDRYCEDCAHLGEKDCTTCDKTFCDECSFIVNDCDMCSDSHCLNCWPDGADEDEYDERTCPNCIE